MNFTTAELVVIIAAIAGAMVQVINAFKQSAKTDTIQANTKSLLVKADEIHDQTNSNLSVVKNDLKQARDQIDSLKDAIADLRIEREKQTQQKK